MPSKVRKIVSGGQTGSDRAALDFAITRGMPTGGYVPKGRLAEDGPIDEKYPNLIETKSEDPAERTRLNVLHADATLILMNGKLSGGTKLTESFAEELRKPFLVIDFSEAAIDEIAHRAAAWLREFHPAVLNIAGPRASEDPSIYELTFDLLSKILKA